MPFDREEPIRPRTPARRLLRTVLARLAGGPARRPGAPPGSAPAGAPSPGPASGPPPVGPLPDGAAPDNVFGRLKSALRPSWRSRLVGFAVIAVLLWQVLADGDFLGPPRSEDPAALERRVEEILSGDPVLRGRHAATILALARLRAWQGRAGEADALFDAALTAGPRDWPGHCDHAELLRAMGQTERAGAKFRIVAGHAERDDLQERARRGLAALGPDADVPPPAAPEPPFPDLEFVLLDYGSSGAHLLPDLARDLGRIMGTAARVGLSRYSPGPPDRAALSQLRLLRDLLPAAASRLLPPGTDGQIDADRLLREMRADLLPVQRPGDPVPTLAYIAVTDTDLFAGEANFLFGGALPGYAVISSARFRAAFTGEPPDRRRLLDRLLKQAVSSANFTLGIPRCDDPDCARAYPRSLEEHDAKPAALCPVCARRLRARLVELRADLHPARNDAL
jgi:predicted Zn-dependent protease